MWSRARRDSIAARRSWKITAAGRTEKVRRVGAACCSESWAAFVRGCLSLRYRVEVKGLKELNLSDDGRSILFLASHPALTDPLVLSALLWRYRPRPLADEGQAGRPLIRRRLLWCGPCSFPMWAMRSGVIAGPPRGPCARGCAVPPLRCARETACCCIHQAG